MKRLFTISLLTIIVALAVTARDRIYINDFNIAAGESKTIEVILKNDTTYCALQTDIMLPEGLTIDSEMYDGEVEYFIDLTSRKANNHVVSSNLLDNGAVRVFITSYPPRAFSGNDGVIFTFDVTASADFDKGSVTLSNSVLVEDNGTRHALDDATAGINGGATPPTPSLKGDVNGDGSINASDINVLINIIMGKASAANYGGRADVNQDGAVNASDINWIINYILSN